MKSHDAVLVKGSRGVRMERVVEALVAAHPGARGLMLYHLLFELREQVGLFNVVRYITFRTAMATLSALLIVLLFGPWTIERLRRLKFGQQIRSDGPESHKAKAGTPTMGGILIVAGTLVPTLLWGDLDEPEHLDSRSSRPSRSAASASPTTTSRS